MKRNTDWLTLLFLASLCSGCSSFFYYPSRYLYNDPKSLPVKPQESFFSSQNGSKLFAWSFKTPKPKAIGSILLFHGNAENLSSHFLSFYWILNEGFNLVVFDYQGYGRSEGEPSPKNCFEDGLAAIEWTKREFKNLPLIVVGQSLGGNIAMRAVSEITPDPQIKAIVVDSSFASFKEMGRDVLSRNFITWIFQPLAFVLLRDQYAAKLQLQKLHGLPKIFIHGTKDQAVPFKLGYKLFSEAPEPKEFWKIENGEHIAAFSDPAIREKLVRSLRSLLTSRKPAP